MQTSPTTTFSFPGNPEGKLLTSGGQGVLDSTSGIIYSRPSNSLPGTTGYAEISTPNGGGGGGVPSGPAGGDLAGTYPNPILRYPISTPNVLYVETNGNDATGEVGNPAQPFATLAGAYPVAVAAVTSTALPTVILFGSGTFDGMVLSEDWNELVILAGQPNGTTQLSDIEFDNSSGGNLFAFWVNGVNIVAGDCPNPRTFDFTECKNCSFIFTSPNVTGAGPSASMALITLNLREGTTVVGGSSGAILVQTGNGESVTGDIAGLDINCYGAAINGNIRAIVGTSSTGANGSAGSGITMRGYGVLACDEISVTSDSNADLGNVIMTVSGQWGPITSSLQVYCRNSTGDRIGQGVLTGLGTADLPLNLVDMDSFTCDLCAFNNASTSNSVTASRSYAASVAGIEGVIYDLGGNSGALNINATSEQFDYVPTTGQTITPPYADGTRPAFVCLTPAGTLAALTVRLPAAGTNAEKLVTISTTQTLTSFTVTAVSGSIITPSLTTLAAGGFVSFKSDGTNWRRVG